MSSPKDRAKAKLSTMVDTQRLDRLWAVTTLLQGRVEELSKRLDAIEARLEEAEEDPKWPAGPGDKERRILHEMLADEGESDAD